MTRYTIVLLLTAISFCKSYSQTNPQTDSLVNQILNQNTLTGTTNQGIELVKENKWEQAGLFFSNQIAADASDKEAYFNRGVVNIALSNPENACRDWSSLLALGDTAAFNLLDKSCHGNMIIEDDTIPKKIYRQLFAQSKDAKTLSANAQAINVTDQMPQFPGGDKALVDYLKKNIKYPADAKQNKTQGTVYVNFIISKKGNVLYPYVTHGIGKTCNAEALRVIKSMPAWQPGKLKGKPVLVRYNLPVRFVTN
jgi:TonB family protein